MHRGTIVAGVTAGVLGIGGVATATAAPLPITLDFTSGTVKVGSLASTTQTGTTRLVGTIESDTLVATFPATGVTFAKATAGTLGITPQATGTITGRPNATTGSLDLTGPISYAISGDQGACTIAPTAPVTLTGSAIGFADGSYGASGSGSNASIGVPSAGCLPYLASAGPLTSTALAYSGKLTIPGFIPTPTSVTVIPPSPAPTTPAPATPATPATPAARPGQLAVTISRPKTVRRGSSTVTKVVVRNTGAGTARTVRVRVSAAGKGVTPRATSKAYATIGAGKSRTLNLRLRTTKRAAKSSAVKVAVTGAGGLSAARATTLRLR
ncbi:hypothetical protein [Patulibacter sp.]|uniref:hypothetical protein n=1 Tax=Patulibacter sp. TaxID=1912859 RepID=UPI0027272CF8|nr:hypothetical protein [Patulibacter sp.]MDO9409281.1 hypothetical protein [Patulibacter sp.]